MPGERLFEETLKESAGFLTNRERGLNIPMSRITEVQNLIFNGIHHGKHLLPHERSFLIQEAMTTSDFPYLFADVTDRQMLAAYTAIEPEFRKYMRRGTVNRLYPHIGGKRFAMRLGGMYLDEVAEKGEYLARTKTETKYDVYARKYGNQLDISWEAMIADDLGALQNSPAEMAWLAANTEHYQAVNTYADDIGTHAAGNLYELNVNYGVLPLTIANLETSIQLMQAIRHPSGQPIRNRPKYLVVSDGGLEFTARQILTSTTKMWADGAGGAVTAYPTTNVVSQYGLELIVDPWLSLAATAGFDNNSWYLFADPNVIAAVEYDYLTGHEKPEICMKASDKVAIGGGPLGAMTGDFATDNIFYRIRQCFGANKLDWRATYYNRVAD